MNKWIAGARPKTLPAAIAPVAVATALAGESWDPVLALLALLVSLALQVGVNYANDYSDGVKGTDNEDRIGPERAVQSGAISPKQMRTAIIASSIITFLIAILLIFIAFGKDDFLNLIIFTL